MILFRPVQPNDIKQLEALAKASGALVSTLPEDHLHLSNKVERSQHSFAQSVTSPGDESYLFVLEDTKTGQLLGTGGINALAGNNAPFYSFRHDTKIHSSNKLNVHNRVHALTLNHDLSDHSQLCSFYITPELAEGNYPSLITLSRLIYMRLSTERFAKKWMTVLPGISDKQGNAPFWEHVGRKFFGIDYQQVKHYHGTREKTFIAEMMPYHPLYVALMDEQAQKAIGLVHQQAQLQSSLLKQQGFESDKYVAIFDAGAILTSSSDTIALADKIVPISLLVERTEKNTQTVLLVIKDNNNFTSCLVDGVLIDTQLIVSAETIQTLNISEQANLFAVALNQHNHIDEISVKENNQ